MEDGVRVVRALLPTFFIRISRVRNCARGIIIRQKTSVGVTARW